ncbi:MAG: TonB family protein [Deltaproteobacteria bacterium]|nr:TonB family protein [Deltaproteobacteria bacterium]
MRERWASAAGVAISLALHGGLVLALRSVRGAEVARDRAVEVEIIERPAPPPPAPPAEPPRRTPERVAVARPRPPPPTLAPPPPNQPPPPDAPPPTRAPVRVGVSLSATATSGGVAAPVGNTLYGKAPEVAPDPAEVKPYRAERYLPPAEVSVAPRTVSCEVPQAEYPAEARAAGLQGDVRVKLLVDAEGRVREARALADPGKGLAAAAESAARRHCRFRPAQKDGQPVATEIVFTFRFELP